MWTTFNKGFTLFPHRGKTWWVLFVCCLKSAVAALLFPSVSLHNWTRHCSSRKTMSTLMHVILRDQVWKNMIALLTWKSRNSTKIKFPKRKAVHHFQPTLSFGSYIYTVHYFFTRSKMFLSIAELSFWEFSSICINHCILIF